MGYACDSIQMRVPRWLGSLFREASLQVFLCSIYLWQTRRCLCHSRDCPWNVVNYPCVLNKGFLNLSMNLFDPGTEKGLSIDRHKNFLHPWISFLLGFVFSDVTMPVGHDFGFLLHSHPQLKVILSRPRPLFFIYSFVASSSMLDEDTLMGSVFLLCHNSTMTASEVIRVWSTLWKTKLTEYQNPACLFDIFIVMEQQAIYQVASNWLLPMPHTGFHIYLFSVPPSESSLDLYLLQWFGNTVLRWSAPVPFTLPTGCWPSHTGMIQCFTGQEVLQFHWLRGISFHLPAILMKRKFYSGLGLQLPVPQVFSTRFQSFCIWEQFQTTCQDWFKETSTERPYTPHPFVLSWSCLSLFYS